MGFVMMDIMDQGYVCVIVDGQASRAIDVKIIFLVQTAITVSGDGKCPNVMNAIRGTSGKIVTCATHGGKTDMESACVNRDTTVKTANSATTAQPMGTRSPSVQIMTI